METSVQSALDFYEPDNFPSGISRKVVESISHIKNEPGWVTEFRLRALETYMSRPMPSWGFIPQFKIDLDSYVHYVGSRQKKKKSWDEVDPEVLRSFERLGIPEHERRYLAGLEAMNDSETVYANVKKELADLGIIFCDIDTAIREYPEIVKKYIGSVVTPEDNKFAALNSAVFSGGSFAYCPRGVKTPMPLQAYFKVTAASSGQYERTLLIADEGSEIVYSEGCSSVQDSGTNFHTAVVELVAHKDARIHYTTIQNWKKNMYNWTVKRGIAHESAHITWTDVNIGAQTIKYPGIILAGDHATGDVLSLAFAGGGQIQDTGARIIHVGKNTRSNVLAKGVSLDGGINSYRGLVKFEKGATGAMSHVKCDGLMMDARSESHAYPYNDVSGENGQLNYEATVSRINDDQLFYLQSRGLSEDEAKLLIVSGFCEGVVRDLNVEYSVEMTRLIRMILEDGKAIAAPEQAAAALP
ncbi:MAG TPA: Fe-S cluster assembly protein SufB [Leptospiraceae bacterium]|nr:Fe-S cluster assembly protein SufB [Leptospirales bacterium]HMX57474.1 Fe-S cluster assembly protein SufB [Leptospiraceae bacterium]HMY44181.1 Fe-S cluster assembly protein SufB [Leptospiraceae bacterium]HMZ37581.1 Fe-S cluster assembly protein SufB [Leptospiraceae bacterium]HNE24125.1 Fe-S cluster assembly protein SufB [Leptospiraceae bacterium]